MLGGTEGRPFSAANLPEVTAAQIYVGTARPFDFNGMVRHYYLRQEPWQAEVQIQLLNKTERHRSSHEIAVEARALVNELLDEMWGKVVAGEHISTRERAIFQLACSDAVRGCVAAVDVLCDAAGTTANRQDHPLERIARDVRVVRQHLTVASHQIDDAGRVLLGLPAEGLMLAGQRD